MDIRLSGNDPDYERVLYQRYARGRLFIGALCLVAGGVTFFTSQVIGKDQVREVTLKENLTWELDSKDYELPKGTKLEVNDELKDKDKYDVDVSGKGWPRKSVHLNREFAAPSAYGPAGLKWALKWLLLLSGVVILLFSMVNLLIGLYYSNKYST